MKNNDPYWLDEHELKEVNEIIKSGNIAQGEEIEKFEKDFAKDIGVKYAISVNSGTAALHVGLESSNIEKGDIITTPLSFISTANSILYTGSKPIFCDVSKESLNLDSEKVKKIVNSKTKAILGVHLYGYPLEINNFKKICKENNISLVEDCAQALGTKYHEKSIGTFGDFGAFSFYDSKHLKLGEGGMIVTDNKGIAEKAKMIRSHGMSSTYKHEMFGYNYRFNNILAKIGQIQLKKIKKIMKERVIRGKIYKEELKDQDSIIIPQTKLEHSYYRFPILIKNKSKRDKVVKNMNNNKNNISVGYPMPIYKQPVFKDFSKKVWMSKNLGSTNYNKIKCQNTELITKSMIELPTNPSIPIEEIYRIIKLLKNILDRL